MLASLAHRRDDEALVDALRAQELLAFDAMLVGVHLEVDVVQHADGGGGVFCASAFASCAYRSAAKRVMLLSRNDVDSGSQRDLARLA